MKDVKHDSSDRINRLGPAHVPDKYPFPLFPLFSMPLFPFFFIFLYPSSDSLCKYAKRMVL
jgi:hypothetical protein